MSKTTKVQRQTTNNKQQSLSDIINILLANRCIKTEKEKEEFYNPSNPQKINLKDVGIDAKEIKKAVTRITEAIKNNEKIIVYGDYDVDGICSTAILWETLVSLGANAMPYIPSRFTEGYGLNAESLKQLKDENPDLKLLITVDQGIVANEKIDFAKSLGLDVIITDPHEPGETPPNALAIVHTTTMSGSGVSWILSKELRQVMGTRLQEDHLGLAALGTVSDVLPLIGVNRSIAFWGLKELRKTERPGIKALVKEAVIDQREIDTYHIGYIISPRLNAMGRLEHAMDSLRLICTKDHLRAQELAAKLGKTNRARQEKTDTTLQHVDSNFGCKWNGENLPKILFAYHESYEEGIIGIAAGRLVDKYYRPAIVISRGEEFSKASARSVSGVNIIELIRKVGSELYVNAGGHSMAAGFTIRTENLEILKRKLNEACELEITSENLTKKVRVDCDLDFDKITPSLYLELEKFTPFGFGNPEPTFQSTDVHVVNSRLVGKTQEHLKLQLVQGEGEAMFDAIAFRMGKYYSQLSPDKPIQVVYSIEKDEWNGRKKLQLKIKDIQIS